MKMGKIKNAQPWTESETIQLIAAYVYLRSVQGAVPRVTKTSVYKPLAEKLGRGVPSIEQKFMNVSGVLKAANRPELIVKGYAPTDGFKKDMIDLVKLHYIDIVDAEKSA